MKFVITMTFILAPCVAKWYAFGDFITAKCDQGICKEGGDFKGVNVPLFVGW